MNVGKMGGEFFQVPSFDFCTLGAPGSSSSLGGCYCGLKQYRPKAAHLQETSSNYATYGINDLNNFEAALLLIL